MSLIVSPTRSRQRASLETSALTIPTRQNVRITSLEKLQNFVLLGAYNANIGRVVEDLNISLPLNTGYPAQVVRAALRLTPNIESLVLELPLESPITLLNGLNFFNLRVFSTNLPHRALTAFISAHPRLQALALQDCGRRGTCPLRGLELRDLSNLQCPSRCFVGITRGSLVVATVNLSRLTSMASLAIRTLSSSNLHSLTVDFFVNDYDVLLLVTSATPNLRKLKLNEKTRPQRRHEGGVRRPWNDLREWHNVLLRLPLLEELMLRTLVSVASPSRTELDVVTAWADGTGRRAVPHPALYHIALIQKGTVAGVAHAQQLSHWFKRQSGAWGRLTSTPVGPSQSFTL